MKHSNIDPDTTKYISPKQAAAMTGLSPLTWRKYARQGKIGSVKIGWKTLIPVTEIKRIMSEGYRPAIEVT